MFVWAWLWCLWKAWSSDPVGQYRGTEVKGICLVKLKNKNKNKKTQTVSHRQTAGAAHRSPTAGRQKDLLTGPTMQASRRSSPQDPPTGPVCRQEPGCWEGPEAGTAAMGHSLLVSYWLRFTNSWLLIHLWSAYSNQISTLQAAFYLDMGRNLGKMCFPSHCSYPSSWFLVYNTVSFFPSDSCCK